jgi:peptidoglycan/xylan/chitin deacetylase (PgdA/CDA1 family)
MTARMATAARTMVLAAPAMALAGHVLPAATWLPRLRGTLFPALAGIGAPDHVALTFDDGPDPSSTPRFLDALDALGVQATFFLVGDSAQHHRRLAAAVAARGHELAVHGWTHDRPWLPSVRGEARGLRGTAALIADLTGTAPRWYRPPYGILTGGRGVAAARAGLRPVLWSAWGRDWTPGATAASVRGSIARDLRGGGTVLLHDADRSGRGGWHPALAALPELVADCRARDWTVGPLAEHWSPGVRALSPASPTWPPLAEAGT